MYVKTCKMRQHNIWLRCVFLMMVSNLTFGEFVIFDVFVLLKTCIAKTTYFTDFNLSGGCFGTEIIKNGTKWSNIGVHGLSIGPIEAEFQGASFLIQKNAENANMVQQKYKKSCFP